jgi:hypothetical protein
MVKGIPPLGSLSYTAHNSKQMPTSELPNYQITLKSTGNRLSISTKYRKFTKDHQITPYYHFKVSGFGNYSLQQLGNIQSLKSHSLLHQYCQCAAWLDRSSLQASLTLLGMGKQLMPGSANQQLDGIQALLARQQ